MTKVRQSNLSSYTTTILLGLQQVSCTVFNNMEILIKAIFVNFKVFENIRRENSAGPSSVMKDIEPLKV